ncbi:hypothetical protein ACQUFY_15305 [Robbsia andropogonis]|uniref:hypothetical protein n=1 Tax=Robbsia andropogonis TaxID=28092 RepID=UPI003D1A97FA
MAGAGHPRAAHAGCNRSTPCLEAARRRDCGGGAGSLSRGAAFGRGTGARGGDPVTDEAIAKRDAIVRFLRQGVHEHSTFEETLGQLIALAR